MWPQRDALHVLYREPTEAIAEETRIHLRDCIDHCNHIIDLLENYREISASLLDIYLSMTSQRMNEIMKVLTIIATTFIPLTFIVGVYGMNFNPEASPWNMPELEWAYGYPAIMLLMLSIAVAMLFFFRRKGWLGPIARIEPSDTDGPYIK
jgi:magnesium transporter